jgi:hypothetical protein
MEPALEGARRGRTGRKAVPFDPHERPLPLIKGVLIWIKPNAPVIGTFCRDHYCDGMETFMLVYDTLVVAAIVVILIGIKPVP